MLTCAVILRVWAQAAVLSTPLWSLFRGQRHDALGSATVDLMGSKLVVSTVLRPLTLLPALEEGHGAGA